MRVKAQVIEMKPAEKQVIDKLLGRKFNIAIVGRVKRKKIGLMVSLTKENGKYFMNLSVGVVTE